LIKGEEISLKPFDLEDIDFLLRWNNDLVYTGEYEPYESVSREELAKWLPRVKTGQFWYIVITESGERVGQVVGRTQTDGSIQVGYRIVPSARRRGYCTKAVRLLIDYLFTQGVARITAEVNPRNVSSRRVLEKLGFKEIMYKEKAVKINNVWLDGIVYELRS
jgi:RimJ/RimL family protein N-acetyltransferase